MSIRVLVVDDHPVVLTGLSALIGSDPGLEVVATARSVAEALAVDVEPDVALLDLQLPDGDGIALGTTLKQQWGCRVLILTMNADGPTVIRALAGGLGFGGSDLTVVATVISELARNIIEYATTGTIMLETIERNGRSGLGIQAVDQGPGIDDIARALSASSPTASGLGLGLSGVRRMVDEFEVASQPGRGTTVTVRKWLP